MNKTLIAIGLVFVVGCSGSNRQQTMPPVLVDSVVYDETHRKLITEPDGFEQVLLSKFAQAISPPFDLATAACVHLALTGHWPEDLQSLRQLVQGSSLDLSRIRDATFRTDADGTLTIHAVVGSPPGSDNDRSTGGGTIKLDPNLNEGQRVKVEKVLVELREKNTAENETEADNGRAY